VLKVGDAVAVVVKPIEEVLPDRFITYYHYYYYYCYCYYHYSP